MHITSLLSNSSDGNHFSNKPSDDTNTFQFIPMQVQLDSQGTRFSLDKSKEDIKGLVQEVLQLQDKSIASTTIRERRIKLLLILLLSKSTEVQCAVIDGLCELCMATYAARENQDTIISLNVVDSIDGIQLISALLKSERLVIQLAATRLVGALCVKNDNVKGVISSSSVIPSLISLLQSDNTDVQKNAGAAICCAVDDDLRNKNVVYRSGGITALNAILSRPNNDCAVLLAVVSCVGALVTGFPAAQNAVRNLNMIPTLVSSVYSAPPSMLARLACCIAEVARDNTLNAKAIVSAGGLQAACHILNSFASSPLPQPELLFHTLALLWCLCKDSPKRCSCARRISPTLLPALQTLTLYTFCANVRAAATLALRTVEQA